MRVAGYCSDHSIGLLLNYRICYLILLFELFESNQLVFFLSWYLWVDQMVVTLLFLIPDKSFFAECELPRLILTAIDVASEGFAHSGMMGLPHRFFLLLRWLTNVTLLNATSWYPCSTSLHGDDPSPEVASLPA